METWDLAVVAALVLFYAVISRRLQGVGLTAAILFVTAGLIIGPELLGIVELPLRSEQVRLLAEATLTLILFADAAGIDTRALRREAGMPVRLLGIGLPLTIIAGLVVGVLVLDVLTWPEALVLAVVLAPTDAALGQAVVSDERLPRRLRQGLNVESGLNDGICVPLLFIAIAIAEAEEGVVGGGHAARLVVEEIGWGVVGGVIAGAIGALALRMAIRREWVDGELRQLVPIAAAALSYGIAAPLGGSGFIAAFVGGLVYGHMRGHADEEEETGLLHLNGQILNGVTLVVFGAVALGPALEVMEWKLVLYAVLSLTVIRMLPVAASLLGSGDRWPTVAFAGWFGPRGLASIVFAVIVLDGADLEHLDLMITTIALTVGLSVYAHGLTAAPFTRRLVGSKE